MDDDPKKRRSRLLWRRILIPVAGPMCVEPNTGNDQCGVHSNSGVLNKWYYLMVEGSGQVISRFWKNL
jgi:hypothetical protein